MVDANADYSEVLLLFSPSQQIFLPFTAAQTIQRRCEDHVITGPTFLTHFNFINMNIVRMKPVTGIMSLSVQFRLSSSVGFLDYLASNDKMNN
jgi:hypothetical protein